MFNRNNLRKRKESLRFLYDRIRRMRAQQKLPPQEMSSFLTLTCFLFLPIIQTFPGSRRFFGDVVKNGELFTSDKLSLSYQSSGN